MQKCLGRICAILISKCYGEIRNIFFGGLYIFAFFFFRDLFPAILHNAFESLINLWHFGVRNKWFNGISLKWYRFQNNILIQIVRLCRVHQHRAQGHFWWNNLYRIHTANLEKVVHLKYTFSQKQSHLHISCFWFFSRNVVSKHSRCHQNYFRTVVLCVRLKILWKSK